MTSSTRSRTRAEEQARQLAARQKAARRRTVLRIGALVVGALVVAIAIAVAVSLGGDDSTEGPGPVVVPASATADGSIAIGQADAPVTVTVFFDYMCPFCGRFEAEEFTGWVADVTTKAFDSGITGTSTVLVDGQVFKGDLYSEGPLTQAVVAAAEGQ